MRDALAHSSGCTLRLIGVFGLTAPNGEAIAVSSRRGRALILYLALAGEAGATRERLAGLFWSDRGDAQARASLRQCLLELKTALAPASLDLLDVGRERIALRPGLTSDVGRLEAALGASDAAAVLAALLACGQGRLGEDLEIAGLFADWLVAARARFEARIANGVHACLEYLEQQSDWPRVRAIAEAYLHLDPLDEPVVAAAMRADAASGSASSAHRRFQVLEAALARELGLQPGAAARSALASLAQKSASAPASGAEPFEGPPLVVVAAFEAPDPASSEGQFVGALREEVVSGLSRFRDLRLVTEPKAMAEIGGEGLGEPARAYVLGASLRAFGGVLRLTVQLVRTGDRHVLWSDQFALTERDLVELIDEVISKIVGAVLPTIDADLLRRASRIPTTHAYERYVVARDRAQRAASHQEAKAAATDLTALIASEPDFPLPYLPLARLLNTDYGFTLAGSSGPAERTEALRLAKQAIAIDRAHVHGYTVTGWCYLRQREWKLAKAYFDQALALNRFYAGRVVEVGFGFIFLDDLEKARGLLDRALLLNPAPDDELFLDLGFLELVRGDHERAASYFALVAGNAFWAVIHGAINAAMGGRTRPDSAEAAGRRIAAIWPAARPMTNGAVVDWIADQHPFQSAEMAGRFLEGAQLMVEASGISARTPERAPP